MIRVCRTMMGAFFVAVPDGTAGARLSATPAGTRTSPMLAYAHRWELMRGVSHMCTGRQASGPLGRAVHLEQVSPRSARTRFLNPWNTVSSDTKHPISELPGPL